MARDLVLSQMDVSRPIGFVEVQYRPPPDVGPTGAGEEGLQISTGTKRE